MSDVRPLSAVLIRRSSRAFRLMIVALSLLYVTLMYAQLLPLELNLPFDDQQWYMILYSAQRIVLLILAAMAARNIGLRWALIILGVCVLASLPYLLFVVDPGWLKSLVLETAMVWLVALALIWLIDTYEKNRRALLDYQGNLEQRVIDSSAQLRSTNHLLEMDISRRQQVEQEKERAIDELRNALSQVKQLADLLPICVSCKKIRDDTGYWHSVDLYLNTHAGLQFTHGICPECTQLLYPSLIQEGSDL
jgi:hypothetical protein